MWVRTSNEVSRARSSQNSTRIGSRGRSESRASQIGFRQTKAFRLFSTGTRYTVWTYEQLTSAETATAQQREGVANTVTIPNRIREADDLAVLLICDGSVTTRPPRSVIFSYRTCNFPYCCEWSYTCRPKPTKYPPRLS